MKGATVILPLLNEDFPVLEKIILTIINTFDKLELMADIIIVDGGSEELLINKVRSCCEKLRGEKIKMRYSMNYPMIKPNKNIGISNAYNVAMFEDILIIDSDNTNLTSEKLKEIINLLSKYSLVVPDLERTGGRSNRLLGNPPMRLFFPEIYEKIKYPYPGLLAIKKGLLGEIIANDYCFDWGGETQLAINGYLLSGGDVGSLSLNKVDSKKRSIKSMTGDSFQIYRTNLLLAIQNNRFPEAIGDVDLLIRKDIENHPEDSKRLEDYLKNTGMHRLIDGSLFGFYQKLSDLYRDDPGRIYRYVSRLAKKYENRELETINTLVVGPLLKILFNIDTPGNCQELNEETIRGLKMQKISFLADVLVSVMIKIYLDNGKKKPFSDLETMLDNSSKDHSEFNDIGFKTSLDESLSGGISLLEINQDFINKLGEIIKIENTKKRNVEMGLAVKERLIGEVRDEKITTDGLRLKTENLNINNDLFVNLSILTTISGYLKCNKILVNAGIYQEKKKLESFLSYVLNNKKFSPMEFDLTLNFTGNTPKTSIAKHDYDCVVLFSGGIDSTAALLNALDKGMNPLLLWVGFGQKNEYEEHEKIKEISKKIRRSVSVIRVDLKEFIEEGWKEWDYIIPARNFMFVAFAASFLSNSTKDKTVIYLSAHEEEIKHTNTDKSEFFFETCTNMFSDFYNKKITIDTPFKKESKTEILARWKNFWLDKYNISPYDTVTCYYGNNCGDCKACLKRTIALLASGWKPDPDLKINPMKDRNGFLEKDILLRFGDFSEKRKIETLIAIEKSWNSVPDTVKKQYGLVAASNLKKMAEYKKILMLNNVSHHKDESCLV